MNIEKASCSTIAMIGDFISHCLDKNPDLDTPNFAGKTVNSLIVGTEDLQHLLRKDV